LKCNSGDAGNSSELKEQGCGPAKGDKKSHNWRYSSMTSSTTGRKKPYCLALCSLLPSLSQRMSMGGCLVGSRCRFSVTVLGGDSGPQMDLLEPYRPTASGKRCQSPSAFYSPDCERAVDRHRSGLMLRQLRT
jgi:hypothetical protein